MTILSENTLQLWPRGTTVHFRGDVHGPSIEILEGKMWRAATPEEHRAVKIEEMAKLYIERDILFCDSSLVSSLIQESYNSNSEVVQAFSMENVENIRPNPQGWDLEECVDWLKGNGHDIPDEAKPVEKPTVEEVAKQIQKAKDGYQGYIDDGEVDEQERLQIEFEFDKDGSWSLEFGQNVGSSVMDYESSLLIDLRNTSAEDVAKQLLDAIGDVEMDEDAALEAARKAVEENAEDAEVYEWWRVSRWLCSQLKEIGEPVLDNDYGEWYGRTTTGQSMLMDGVLQRIASKFA